METSRFRGDPSPDEAAAVIAAIEEYLRDTAPKNDPPPPPGLSAWKRAALEEGVSRQP